MSDIKNKKIITEKLEQLINTDTIVELYTNDDETTMFAAGFIKGLSEENILIYEINQDGEYDGYIVFKLENIYRISYDTLYTIELYEKIKQNGVFHKDVEIISSNQFVNIVNFSKKENKIMSITLFNSEYDDVIGIMNNMDDYCVEINMIDIKGNKDGQSIVCFKDISRIVCDSEDEQLL
ncbi:MAG: hypothetical protein RR483_01650 [Clostridia bacterium]